MLPAVKQLVFIAFASCLSIAVYLRMRKKWALRARAMQDLRDMKN